MVKLLSLDQVGPIGIQQTRRHNTVQPTKSAPVLLRFTDCAYFARSCVLPALLMDKVQTHSIYAKALRELRGRGPINTPAQTPQEAREQLAGYVIHPAFYESSASALAYEFMLGVLKREPTDDVTLWALYTEAACVVLGRPDTVPVPAFEKRVQGKA